MSKRITKYSILYWINAGFNEKEAKIKADEFNQSMRKYKKICKEYWIYRGFSEESAAIKIKEYQSNRCKLRKTHYTPSQVEFWMNKGLSEIESNEKVQLNLKKTNKLCVDYWVNRGNSEEEAKLIISNMQSNTSKKVKNRKNGRNIESFKQKGYTIDEAKLKLRDMQTTFSLEKCISKHGEELGLIIFKNRQIKWQNTLNNKSKEEKDRINKSKIVNYDRMLKTYGKDRADSWIKSKFNNYGKTFSKISLELFTNIHKIFPEELFYYGENEYVWRREKHTYILDFYWQKYNKIIEFNGDLFHANPAILRCR
jgi:hypothetical protein